MNNFSNKRTRQQIHNLPRLVTLQGVPGAVRWVIVGLLGNSLHADTDSCLDRLARAAYADDDDHVHASEAQIETQPSVGEDACEIDQR